MYWSGFSRVSTLRLERVANPGGLDSLYNGPLFAGADSGYSGEIDGKGLNVVKSWLQPGTFGIERHEMVIRDEGLFSASDHYFADGSS